MNSNVDNLKGILNSSFWFVTVFFAGRRRKCAVIIYFLVFFSESLPAQYSDNIFFKTQINYIYKSQEINVGGKIKELLKLEQKMNACHLEKDSTFMVLLQKIGKLYFRQSNYSGAIDFTNRSVFAAKEFLKNHKCNAGPLVDNYYNLYYYYNQTVQLKKKYDTIDSLITYVLKANSGFDLVIAPLTDKTDYLFNKGEYVQCSNNAKLGLDIIQKYFHGHDSIYNSISFLNSQASALYFSKNIPAAEKLLEEKKAQFEQTGNSKYIGAFYGLLGMINTENKNYPKALYYFKKAYNANFAIKFGKGCATSLTSIGTLYAKNFAKYATGLAYCTSALKFADAADSLLILSQTGDIYVLKGQFDKAQHFYQQAYNTIANGINETSLLRNTINFPGFNQLQNLLDLAIKKGDAYLQQYYHTGTDDFLKKALNVYKKADLFLAKIKTEQQLEMGSNLIWRTTARHLYEHAIEACYADNKIEDAFYFFEKSRAILLNDQINEQRWMADRDIVKQANLKKTIIEVERNLATIPPSSNDYLEIQKKLYTSQLELHLLTGSIKNNSPAFYQNYLDTVFITVEQLRKTILNNSKTLVEIFSGDSAVFVITVTPNDQSLTKLNKQWYDSLTHSFNSFITSPYRLNKGYKEFVRTGNQLYRLLFSGKLPPVGSIIISPDGVSYPFEALAMSENDRQPDYFLKHYAVSYTYSAKYLTNQFAANINTGNSVLGIAPVQYKYRDLAELSGSDLSLKKINSYFSNATNYVFDKATRGNFQRNFPRYSIVQLYTHAADNKGHGDPVIYFSDSTFYLSDLIADCKPVTQLVVLSACETANGKLYEGEGIFSFNRGFAALGIPAAISNLWSVDNESTYRITEFFYKYLSWGLPTDMALQKAKLEFIHTSSSQEKTMPYYWASPILIGKVDTIKASTQFPVKRLAASTIFVVLIAWLTGKLAFRKTPPARLKMAA